MADELNTTETFYRGWHDYQEAVIRALAPLTPEQLALRPAPELRSIGMIATHMVGARARWLQGLMGEGGVDLADMATWDRPSRPARTATELVDALHASWQVLAAALARWTSEDMAHVFRGERGNEQYAFTRQWVIWHLIEHDVHHGGEISLALGMHGLQAPDI